MYNISIGNGERKIKMDQDFFKGYRKTAVLSDEVVLSILIPYTHSVRIQCLMSCEISLPTLIFSI